MRTDEDAQNWTLLEQLAASGRTETQYAMHVRWDSGEEDWMPCDSKESLDYRLAFWTERGRDVTATPMSRTVTLTGWAPVGTTPEPAVEAPVPGRAWQRCPYDKEDRIGAACEGLLQHRFIPNIGWQHLALVEPPVNEAP